MKAINYIIALVIILSATACGDENEVFKREQYEKTIYIISNSDQVFSLEFNLDGSGTPGVSVSCSGSNPLDQEVVVTFEYVDGLVSEYNLSNYDLDEELYAKELASSLYSLPSMELTLSPEDEFNYGILPVEMTLDALHSLSLDTTYFIPLGIKGVSTYEVNPDKQDVLVKVLKKNKYAGMKENTYYLMSGVRNEDAVTNSGKILLPYRANAVRMYVGATNYAPANATLSEIYLNSVIATINEDYSVALTPFREGEDGIQVEMLEAAPGSLYTNRYDPEEKCFYLYYRYRNYNSNAGDWGNWIEIQEMTKYNTAS